MRKHLSTIGSAALLPLLAACGPPEPPPTATPTARVPASETTGPLENAPRHAQWAPDAIRVGQTAPDFELSDEKGNSVALARTLEAGPVVAVFYRGDW